jgi:YbbR domain-containing protein
MADYVINPSVVTASGASASLAGLQRLETDPIDLTGMKADTTFTVSVRRPAGIRLVSPSSVRVRVNIRPMAKTGAR